LTLARPAGGSAPRVTISAVSCASATSDAGSATRRSPRSDGWRHSPKVGQTFQTVPTVVFFTRELEPLDRYVEFTAIYHKVGLAKAMQAHAGVDKPGESREQAWDRFIRDWGALQDSPFWQVWTSAAVDEMISALHERLVVGP